MPAYLTKRALKTADKPLDAFCVSIVRGAQRLLAASQEVDGVCALVDDMRARLASGRAAGDKRERAKRVFARAITATLDSADFQVETRLPRHRFTQLVNLVAAQQPAVQLIAITHVPRLFRCAVAVLVHLGFGHRLRRLIELADGQGATPLKPHTTKSTQGTDTTQATEPPARPKKPRRKGCTPPTWQTSVRQDAGIVAARIASPPPEVVLAATTINQLCSGDGALRAHGLPVHIPVNFERRRRFINEAAHRVFASADKWLHAPVVRCVLFMLRLVLPASNHLTCILSVTSCERTFQPMLCVLRHYDMLSALVDEVRAVAKAYFDAYASTHCIGDERPPREVRAVRAAARTVLATEEGVPRSRLDASFSAWMQAFPDLDALLQ